MPNIWLTNYLAIVSPICLENCEHPAALCCYVKIDAPVLVKLFVSKICFIQTMYSKQRCVI